MGGFIFYLIITVRCVYRIMFLIFNLNPLYHRDPLSHLLGPNQLEGPFLSKTLLVVIWQVNSEPQLYQNLIIILLFRKQLIPQPLSHMIYRFKVFNLFQILNHALIMSQKLVFINYFYFYLTLKHYPSKYPYFI